MTIRHLVDFLSLIKQQVLSEASAIERTNIQVMNHQTLGHFTFTFGHENHQIISHELDYQNYYCLLQYRQKYYYKCLFDTYQQIFIFISTVDNVSDVKIIPNNSKRIEKRSYGRFTTVDGAELLEYAYQSKLSQYFSSFQKTSKLGMSNNPSAIGIFWSVKEYISFGLMSKQYKLSILGFKNDQKIKKLMKSKIQQSINEIYKVNFNMYGDLQLTITQQKIINIQPNVKGDKLKEQMNKAFKEYNLRVNEFPSKDQLFEQTLSLYM